MLKPTYFNVTDFGAVGDDATDSTAAITAAITAAHTRGGGTIYFPPGTYRTGKLTLYPKVHLLGAGYETSSVKLKAGANSDLIAGSVNGYTDGTMCDITRGWTSAGGALWGTGTSDGVYGWSIRDLTLDGNNSQQTSGSGCGIRVYGYGYILQNVRVRNTWSHGIYSDYNPSNSFYIPGTQASPSKDVQTIECQLINVKVDHSGTDVQGNVVNAGAEGIRWAGPTDCMFNQVVSSRNSSHSFHIGPNGGAILMQNCHAWGPPLGIGACNYFVEGGDFSSFVNCVSDGSDPTGAGVLLIGNALSWTGGIIFGIPHDTTMQGTGLELGQLAGGTPRPGAVYQQSGVNLPGWAENIRIDTVFANCVNAIAFTAESNNSIQATIRQDPQYQHIDLSSTNGTSSAPVVSSDTYTFVVGDVGKTVSLISTFGGWKRGNYTIASVSGGKATLNAAIGTVDALAWGTWALGDLSSTNGTASAAVVASSSYSFTANDVGKYIQITGGSNWTTGWYHIVSVAAGKATLDAAVGTLASVSNGNWVMGGSALTGTWSGSDSIDIQVANWIGAGDRNLGGGHQISALSQNALIINDGQANNVLNVNTNSKAVQLLSSTYLSAFADSWYLTPLWRIDNQGLRFAPGDGTSYDAWIYRQAPNVFVVNNGVLLQNNRGATANTAILTNDHTIIAQAWSGPFTLTLPTTPLLNQRYEIVKADPTYNAVTIDGGTHNIGFAGTTFVLNQPSQSVVLSWDGSRWYAVAGGQISSSPQWQKFTVGQFGGTWYVNGTGVGAASSAGTTQQVPLFTTAARQVVHDLVLKTSIAFAATGSSAITASVGTAAAPGALMVNPSDAFDVKQAVASTAFYHAPTPKILDFNATAVILQIITSGATPAAITNGTLEIDVLLSAIP